MKFNNKKYKYGLTNLDLKGDIKDFPLEVVEKMMGYQAEESFISDVRVFQENKEAGYGLCGFTWNETHEGKPFWHNVISLKDFDMFFRKYPK